MLSQLGAGAMCKVPLKGVFVLQPLSVHLFLQTNIIASDFRFYLIIEPSRHPWVLILLLHSCCAGEPRKPFISEVASPKE